MVRLLYFRASSNQRSDEQDDCQHDYPEYRAAGKVWPVAELAHYGLQLIRVAKSAPVILCDARIASVSGLYFFLSRFRIRSYSARCFGFVRSNGLIFILPTLFLRLHWNGQLALFAFGDRE